MMNKKTIGVLLGTLAFGAMTVNAYAGDDAAKPAKEAKGKKKGKKDGDDKKGGEKSCGADGKSCSGKKDTK